MDTKDSSELLLSGSNECDLPAAEPCCDVHQRFQAALLPACGPLLFIAALCLGAILLQPVLLGGSSSGGNSASQQPFCRKSSSIAVLAGPAAAEAQPADDGKRHRRLSLIAWSGIGKHKAMFDDLFSFDLASHSWRALQPQPGPAPVSRWKAGNAQAVQNGLVVVGGDAYTPHTRHHEYVMDVWRLEVERMRWVQAYVAPDAPTPLPRRGHSTAHYTDAHGVDRIIIFGGRTRDKVLLNDAWEVTLLMWPGGCNATWRQLTSLQPASDKAPAPRRGHSAVIVPRAESPQMLVYGGREDLYYYGDMWLLDVASRSWSRVQPSGGAAPSARDHHSVAFFRGEMVVFGGHTGVDYCHAHPDNQVWAFSLEKQEWRRVLPDGRAPLPRFEQAYVQYQPVGGTEESRLLIFGGQTGQVCQLNDVWELSFERPRWRWAELSAPRFCTRACRKRYGGSG